MHTFIAGYLATYKKKKEFPTNSLIKPFRVKPPSDNDSLQI